MTHKASVRNLLLLHISSLQEQKKIASRLHSSEATNYKNELTILKGLTFIV